jgi:hypothetical protein
VTIENLVYPLDDKNWNKFLNEVRKRWPDISAMDLNSCKKNVNALVSLVHRCTTLSEADVIYQLKDIIHTANIVYLDEPDGENMFWDPSWKKYFADTDYKLSKHQDIEYEDFFYTGSDH